REEDERLTGDLEYNPDLFDATTIGRMVGHFQTLLEGLVANPDRRIAEAPLLTKAEHRQLLVEWNPVIAKGRPSERYIHEQFEAQAARTPDAVAVVFDQRPTTNDQRPQ